MSAFPVLDTEVCSTALDELRPVIATPILNHSVRTLVLADAVFRASGEPVDPTQLVVAALFHDSGTITSSSSERFEVVGADRATEFARRLGLDGPAADAVWDAIALHTSPGIAERHRPLTRAIRAGVASDFKQYRHPGVDAGWVAELEERFPRLDIEIVLADAVVSAARRDPRTAPAGSWAADLDRGAGIDWRSGRPNPCF